MSSAAPTGTGAPSTAADTRFFGHPRGLSTLFFTEMWERFSFYGLRAILILFMTAAVSAGGLGFDVTKAGAVYGTYVALVYMLSLPGGWVADKLLGLRKSVLYGGILIMLGQASLAVPGSALFYPGLLFIILGTGLLKPNVSAIVGDLYGPDDIRRDAGFSIFYMGINLGAFISPLIVGWLAQSDGWKAILQRMGFAPETSWHWGFAVGALGMLCGIVQYVLGWKHLGTAGVRPAVAPDSPEGMSARRAAWIGGLVLVVIIGAVAGLVGKGVLSVQAITDSFSWLYARDRGAVLRLAVRFRELDPGRAAAADRHPGAVRGRGDLLVRLRAGRLHAEPLRRDNTQTDDPGEAHTPPSWFQSVNAPDDHPAGAGVRLDLGQAGQARSLEPHQVRVRAPVRGTRHSW